MGSLCAGVGGVKKIVVAYRRGKPFRRHNLYGYRRGVHEKVCYHLRWGKRYKRLNWYAYPAGEGLQSPLAGRAL